MSLTPLIVFFFLGCLLLGGLVLLVTLIVNRKTRPIALVIAGVLALIVMVPVVMYLMAYSITPGLRQKVHVHDYPRFSPHESQQTAPSSPSSLIGDATYEDMGASLIDLGQPATDTAGDAATETASESSTEETGELTEEPTSSDEEGADPRAHAAAEKPDLPPEKQAEPEPAWVTSPPKSVGNSDPHQRRIQSDEFATVEECNRQLDELMRVATAEYLDQLIGTDRFAWHPAHYLGRLGITTGDIRRNICKEEHAKTVKHDFGDMKRVSILMEFDKDIEKDLRRAWKESQLEERLATVGVGSGAVLLLIGAVFGFLKFDTATEGFYTKRLIFAAIAVTIIVPFLTILLWDVFGDSW